MPNLKSLLVGFTVGGAISGIATLFLTPKSGKELRLEMKQTKEETGALIKQLSKNATTLKDDLMDLGKDCSILLKNVSNELKDDIEIYKKEIEPNIKAIQEGIQQLEETIEQTKKELR